MTLASQDALVFEAVLPSDMDMVARKIVSIGPRIVLLEGELGAGKTTLVKGISSALGSDDVVTSPTFTLINEYRDSQGEPIFHVDLYRLSSIEEALQIGIEDYLFSGAWCCVEWPAILMPLINEVSFVRVILDVLKDGTRRICILN